MTSQLSYVNGEISKLGSLRVPARRRRRAAGAGRGGGRPRRARRGRDARSPGWPRPSRRWRSAPCSPASTTPGRRWSPSGPAPAAWTRRTSPRCCCGCTCAGPSGTATRPRSTRPRTPRRPGLKSATFAVKVPYAYGTLSVESGTHRLVRISPFDNQGRRQTSFAGVEVLPVVEQTDHIDIPENEMRVDVYRSSGPGWAERQHHRLGGADHPHPDRHRGHLPEREVPAAEQGLRDAGAPGPAAGAQAPGGAGQDGRA